MAFGALATALALLGIYGVMAYSVSQRTREIGIRMAIGARQATCRGWSCAAGWRSRLPVSWPASRRALGLSQLVQSQLFGVRPSDPLTMASVLVLMTVVAAAAAYLPARRAARVDPVVGAALAVAPAQRVYC